MINDTGRVQKITVDGTDFRFAANGTQWYSHKFCSSAVRYEVGIAIQTGYIVWISDGYPAGQYPDISIFCLGLKQKLLNAGERAEADKGYRGEPLTIELPNDGLAEEYVKKKILRQRHETCNRRFKNWACLDSRFRHGFEYHNQVFKAIAVLTQLDIEMGNELFQVEF